jgi:uncharacterized protein YdeI (YjbR/CyaY-like superfamily)
MKKFTPDSRAAWRRWLEKHHATEPEVWLVYYKKHTGKTTLSYDDSVKEALCFGWIDGIRKRIDDERYTHRFSPRRPGSKWSATNIRRVEALEKAGLMKAAGKKEVAAARKRGEWKTTAPAPAKLAPPLELQHLLDSDREAAANFASLTQSQRQQYFRWIAEAKKAETRERRARKAIEMMAAQRR